MKLKLEEVSQDPSRYAPVIYKDVCVMGSHHRQDECEKFLEAIDGMKLGKDRLGAFLVPDPDNKHDSNALKVRGFVTKKGFFDNSTRTFHIGFVPRRMAFKLTKEYSEPGKLFPKLLEFNYNPDDEYPIAIIFDIFEK